MQPLHKIINPTILYIPSIDSKFLYTPYILSYFQCSVTQDRFRENLSVVENLGFRIEYDFRRKDWGLYNESSLILVGLVGNI